MKREMKAELEPLAIEIFNRARKFQMHQLNINLVEWGEAKRNIKERFYDLADFVQKRCLKNRRTEGR